MSLYPKLIEDALRTVVHPEKKEDIVKLGMLEDDIRISGKNVTFSLIFDRVNDPMVATIKKMSINAIKAAAGDDVEIEPNHIFVKIRKKVEKEESPVLPNVKNIIAISSGKGGVGKSTVTANIAVALAIKGYKVGLLDADIFGPSVPIMFQTEDARPLLSDESTEERQLIEPIVKYGVKMLSIGYFVDPGSAIVWRGGMASNALKQLVTDTAWGDLDYLLIDMPPGTSDIHISLVSLVSLTGAVIVSTPHRVALAYAIKGINMYQNDKVNVPIIGIVENMAYFTPAELPNNKYYIFGQGGAQALAEKENIPFLGQIPLVQSIRENGDAGTPVALVDSSPMGVAFAELADRLVAETQRISW